MGVGTVRKSLPSCCTWMLPPSGVGAHRIHRKVRPSYECRIGCTCTTPTTSPPGWRVDASTPERLPDGEQACSAAGHFAVLRYRGARESRDAFSCTSPLGRSHHQETFIEVRGL